MKSIPRCHPDKEYVGKGLCKTCYSRNSYNNLKKNAEWALERKIRQKKNKLLRDYNITLEDYNLMLIKQENKCLICKRIYGDNLHVDHCHKTGRVRGLLCMNCNTTLGHIENNNISLDEIIIYLKEQLL